MDITKQELFEGTGPEFTAAQAQARQALAEAEVKACVEQREKATTERVRWDDVCRENAEMAQFVAETSVTKTAELAQLQVELRPEFWSLRTDFNLAEHAARFVSLTSQIKYLDSEHQFIVTIKTWGDDISRADSVANEVLAQHRELASMAKESRISLIASLGPAMESHGALAIVDQRTQDLIKAAEEKHKYYLVLREEVDNLRRKYQQQISTLAAKGLATKG